MVPIIFYPLQLDASAQALAMFKIEYRCRDTALSSRLDAASEALETFMLTTDISPGQYLRVLFGKRVASLGLFRVCVNSCMVVYFSN